MLLAEETTARRESQRKPCVRGFKIWRFFITCPFPLVATLRHQLFDESSIPDPVAGVSHSYFFFFFFYTFEMTIVSDPLCSIFEHKSVGGADEEERASLSVSAGCEFGAVNS